MIHPVALLVVAALVVTSVAAKVFGALAAEVPWFAGGLAALVLVPLAAGIGSLLYDEPAAGAACGLIWVPGFLAACRWYWKRTDGCLYDDGDYTNQDEIDAGD